MFSLSISAPYSLTWALNVRNLNLRRSCHCRGTVWFQFILCFSLKLLWSKIFFYLLCYISSIYKLIVESLYQSFSLNCFHILDWKFPEQIESDLANRNIWLCFDLESVARYLQVPVEHFIVFIIPTHTSKLAQYKPRTTLRQLLDKRLQVLKNICLYSRDYKRSVGFTSMWVAYYFLTPIIMEREEL